MNLFVSRGDVVSWVAHGNVLPEANRVDHILFSPKVIYNARSKLYVMWFNYVPGEEAGDNGDSALSYVRECCVHS